MSFETEIILYLRFALIAFAMKLLRCYKYSWNKGL